MVGVGSDDPINGRSHSRLSLTSAIDWLVSLEMAIIGTSCCVGSDYTINSWYRGNVLVWTRFLFLKADSVERFG